MTNKMYLQSLINVVLSDSFCALVTRLKGLSWFGDIDSDFLIRQGRLVSICKDFINRTILEETHNFAFAVLELHTE